MTRHAARPRSTARRRDPRADRRGLRPRGHLGHDPARLPQPARVHRGDRAPLRRALAGDPPPGPDRPRRLLRGGRPPRGRGRGRRRPGRGGRRLGPSPGGGARRRSRHAGPRARGPHPRGPGG